VKYKFIFYYFLFICIFQINASKNLNTKTEEDFNKSSSVFFVITDSIFKTNYDKISLLKDDEQYVKALKYALNLLDEAKTSKDNFWIFKTNYLLGEIYRKTNKPEKSLNSYKQSLSAINKSQLDSKNIQFKDVDLDLAKTLLKLGAAYHKLSRSIDLDGETSKFDIINSNELKKRYLDSAKFYYEKIENFSELNREIINLKAFVYTNMSSIYEVDSFYSKAKEYIDKAIKIHKRNNNSLKTAIALNAKGNIYVSQNNYKGAKNIYNEALDLIKFDNNFDAIETKADLNYNLAWAMRNLQDYKAYDYQEEYIKFQNSKRDREQRMEIEQITADYNVNTAKKEVRLEERNKRLEAQRTFWLAGIIGLSIIFSLGYWLNINNLKRKNLALKLSQSELLQNQNIEKLKSESQVRILNATIDGKESERKQIAEILHDSVSALLSSANLHLQATKKQYNGSTPLEIIKTQEIIQEASHKVRDLSHNLMSSVLLKFGLTIAIRDIAEKYSNSVLTIDTEIIDLRRYSQNFEIKTYNIIQELINNILKHSKANNALIELKEQNSKLFLVISDDGIGFDKTKINLKEGIGINQIDVRIQMMKGKFHIESSANNGTKVTAEIPVIDQLEPNFV
jgi:signal transduction histidine kinase